MISEGASTVLVVEDEAIIAADIQQTLVKFGYLVPSTAASGLAAIHAAKELHPQLVLMDIELRGSMDGIEAAEIIRQQMDVPIVFLTSYADEATLDRAKTAAPSGYIIKPFNERAVRTVVAMALNRHAHEAGLAAALREASVTDELTGLLNRRGFRLLAEQDMKQAARDNRRLVLAFIDVNGMKMINDELGHEAGDRALIDTAAMLRKVFRASDIIARLGGDEFVVLATHAVATCEAAFTLRLRESLTSYNASASSFRLSVSVGAAIFDPSDPLPLDTLLSKADAHMYENKRSRPPSGLNRIKLS
jgi:two-component system cell cycle response regulator